MDLLENENISEYYSSWDKYVPKVSYFYTPTISSNITIPYISNYVNLINVLLLGLFLLILGLTLPKKPKYIKFLHLVGALYVTILLFITPYNSNVKHFRTFSSKHNKIPTDLSIDNPVKLQEIPYECLNVDFKNLASYTNFILARIE